jgi:hypothetical protein
MAPRRNPDLIDSLRVTLQTIEEAESLSPDDPVYQQLKRSILLVIADLERKGNGGTQFMVA